MSNYFLCILIIILINNNINRSEGYQNSEENSNAQIDRNCVFVSEGNNITFNSTFEEEHTISFFLPPLSHPLLNLSSDSLDEKDLKIDLQARQNDDYNVEGSTNIPLNTTAWEPGWNSFNLKVVHQTDSNNLSNYKIFSDDTLNVIIYRDPRLISIKVKGLFSIINCSSEFRYYDVSNSRMILPLEIHDKPTEIKVFSNASKNYYIAVNRNEEVVLLCPDSENGASSRCNNLFRYEFESQKRYEFDFRSLASHAKINFKCEGYAQAQLSIHGLNNVSFLIIMKIPNKEKIDCLHKASQKDCQLKNTFLCNKIWISSCVGIFTMLIGLIVIYFLLRNTKETGIDSATIIAHFRKMGSKFRENIDDEASLTNQEGSKEEYSEYQIGNATYVAFEDRVGEKNDEASLTNHEGSNEEYNEYQIGNATYVAFEDRVGEKST